MLPEHALLGFLIMGDGSRVTRENFKAKDMPFTEAVRLTAVTRGDEPWTMQLGMRNETPRRSTST